MKSFELMSLLKKQRSPACCEAYMDTICKEGLWKKCVIATKFVVYRGEKTQGLETFSRLILS